MSFPGTAGVICKDAATLDLVTSALVDIRVKDFPDHHVLLAKFPNVGTWRGYHVFNIEDARLATLLAEIEQQKGEIVLHRRPGGAGQ